MFHVYARHKVKNFDSWKAAFDRAIELRKKAGELSFRIFHLDEDRDDVLLLFEWDSGEHARQFLQSDELRKKMEESGILGQPEILYLKEAC